MGPLVVTNDIHKTYFESNPIALQSIQLQDTGSRGDWTVGGPTFTNKSDFSRAILPLGQHPSHCYFLSSRGEPRMNTPLSLVTCPTCFLLCLPLSVYFFSLLSAVIFNHVLTFWWLPAHVSVCHHVCVCVCVGVTHGRQGWYIGASWPITYFFIFYVYTFALNSSQVSFFLPRSSPCSQPPSSLFSQSSSSSSPCSHLTTVSPVITLESHAL